MGAIIEYKSFLILKTKVNMCFAARQAWESLEECSLPVLPGSWV